MAVARARMPSHPVGGSGIASDSGSRSVGGQLGSNLRYEAASLQDLEHVRRERIETVDAAVREVDLTFRHVDLDHVPRVHLSPQSRTLQHRESKINRVPEENPSKRVGEDRGHA